MGYVLVGGPQDEQYVDEIPEGYIRQGVNAGVVSEGGSPVTRAVWKEDVDTMNRIIKEQGYRPSDD